MANSHTLSLSFALCNATVINFLSLLKTGLFFIKNLWAIRIINGPKESLIIDNRHHYYSWGVRAIDKYKGLILTPLILNKKPRSPVWNLPIAYQEITLAKGNRDSASSHCLAATNIKFLIFVEMATNLNCSHWPCKLNKTSLLFIRC